MRYNFVWDPVKASRNLRKHRVSFERATMKNEYDFSNGERGKFYRADATLHLPIYLEPDVEDFVRQLAEEKGKDVMQMVNEWLRHDIQLIKSTQ